MKLAPLTPLDDAICVIDQTRLPFTCAKLTLAKLEACAQAIETMQVRGAPLIGATAAFGIALAMRTDASDAALEQAVARLARTRPTAVNLHWALARMATHLRPVPPALRAAAAWTEALAVHAGDIAANLALGQHGARLLSQAASTLARPLRVMTHCNAGALATCGWGTALAPVYVAQQQGIAVEVWVSETRPRNQGLLTAWELAEAGVPHTLIADNAAGHLMRQGLVDIVITGADRIAANGDTANKVGTYLKALAAREHGIPFYIAAPTSTVDAHCPTGDAIPIEARSADEVQVLHGLDDAGQAASLRIFSGACANPAFDVTPAALITGIFTEHGLHTPARITESLQR
ncbi:S-methyl-5-thioribose-1-phosphate isomerase [Niveibacterium sp. 24ML]|uniref:S-methyl-5-thioribose-1-phosphate isomerase n=1 Tax=Niveibacterium sp. 24ML TaxID=2985512 RepID=UPI0022703624|nr:S-methyl-5-thioribose-1-phosphate isomerase [Niveibacterium sp. 24ML]MCX9156973.1 S-methyl-5-thioribose-1-phosphate isomerase [Niveibacterium sp. 24ML]